MVRCKQSNPQLTRMRVASLTALILTGLAHTVAFAGQSGRRSAPPRVEAAMRARAEQFWRAVSSMSPMPPGTDPARAQTWPAPSPKPNEQAYSDRAYSDAPVSVFAHFLWEDPARGPAWVVQGYRGEITIAADGRRVVSFLDTCLSHAIGSDPAPSIQDCISEGTAIARGRRYLTATGIDTRQLVLAQAEITDLHYPPLAATRRWQLRYVRVIRGVPFDDQEAALTLDAGKGRLHSYGCALSAPDPASMQLNVAMEEATQIARRFLTGRNVGPLGTPVAFLRVALQDDWWSADRAENVHTHAPSRLGWLVRFPVQRGAMTDMYEVRVDASTGGIIGGNTWGRERGAASADSHRFVVIEKISHSRQIVIRPVGGADGADRTIRASTDPLAYYGALSNLRLPKIAKAPATFVATHQLIVKQSDGKSVTFEYDSKSGIISAPDGHSAQADRPLRRLFVGSAQ